MIYLTVGHKPLRLSDLAHPRAPDSFVVWNPKARWGHIDMRLTRLGTMWSNQPEQAYGGYPRMDGLWLWKKSENGLFGVPVFLETSTWVIIPPYTTNPGIRWTDTKVKSLGLFDRSLLLCSGKYMPSAWGATTRTGTASPLGLSPEVLQVWFGVIWLVSRGWIPGPSKAESGKRSSGSLFFYHNTFGSPFHLLHLCFKQDESIISTSFILFLQISDVRIEIVFWDMVIHHTGRSTRPADSAGQSHPAAFSVHSANQVFRWHRQIEIPWHLMTTGTLKCR